MATIPYEIITTGQGVTWVVWYNLTGGDVGQAISYLNAADKTVQVFGTIGAAITIEGTCDPLVLTDEDGAEWAGLTDNFGGALVFNLSGQSLIAAAPARIRPNCAAGITNATVAIVANWS